jgi:hypothetical protein
VVAGAVGIGRHEARRRGVAARSGTTRATMRPEADGVHAELCQSETASSAASPRRAGPRRRRCRPERSRARGAAVPVRGGQGEQEYGGARIMHPFERTDRTEVAADRVTPARRGHLRRHHGQ